MIYFDSQLKDSVPPTNAEGKDLRYSRRSESQILVKSTDLAEIPHGQRHQKNFTPSQVSSYLPALRDTAHPSPHLFNVLKTIVGCFLITVCFRFPACLGTCVSTSQVGHSHQLPRIRACLHQTDCTFISHVFASHLDSLHMNNPPILPAGLKTL